MRQIFPYTFLTVRKNYTTLLTVHRLTISMKIFINYLKDRSVCKYHIRNTKKGHQHQYPQKKITIPHCTSERHLSHWIQATKLWFRTAKYAMSLLSLIVLLKSPTTYIFAHIMFTNCAYQSIIKKCFFRTNLIKSDVPIVHKIAYLQIVRINESQF